MSTKPRRARGARRRASRLVAGFGCMLTMGAGTVAAQADEWHHGHDRARVVPGNLLLATSEYVPGDITAGVTQLPPECNIATPPDCATAVADGGDFPSVFNNSSVDPFFGVTSPVFSTS